MTVADAPTKTSNEPVVFISRGDNLMLTLEAPYTVKNHAGQVVKKFSARYIQFQRGSFTLTDELVDQWNVNREREDREESQQRPMLSFEAVVDEIRSNARFDNKRGFWQLDHQPGALEPSIEDLSERIVTASATQNVAEIKRLIEAELAGEPGHHVMAHGNLQRLALLRAERARRSVAFPFLAKMMAEILEVGVDDVGGLVVRQRPALGIEDAAAHGGQAHGAHGLIFLILHVVQRRGYLHVPQAGQQDAHAQHQQRAHAVEAPVLFAMAGGFIHETWGCE